MNRIRRIEGTPQARRAGGFTLIELMIAITIGLFVAVALGAIFLNTRSTFLSQDRLAGLHDSERQVMSILTTEVQLAGYYPDPTTNTLATALPADATNQTYGQYGAGQSVVGISGGAGNSDTFAARFVSASGDGLMNCQGGTNTSGANAVMTSVFSISANNELQCAVFSGGVLQAPVPLVSNVRSMTVLYGADLAGNGNITNYLPAGQMAGKWGGVKSLQITLNFVSPFTAGQVGSAAPVQWVVNIGVMGTL